MFQCEHCGKLEKDPREDIKIIWQHGALSCCHYREMKEVKSDDELKPYWRLEAGRSPAD
ncbi:hypothetical protein [Rhizobium phage RHph_X2_26]|nr:hypothetical protein [Rhizobium phage RHph_X2_26]